MFKANRHLCALFALPLVFAACMGPRSSGFTPSGTWQGTERGLGALAPGAAAKLVVKPASLVFESVSKRSVKRVTVSELGYKGKFTLKSGCGKGVGVTPSSGTGPVSMFEISPKRAAFCSITFMDAAHKKARLSISAVILTEHTLTFHFWTSLASGPAGALWATGNGQSSSQSSLGVASITTHASVSGYYAMPPPYSPGDGMVEGPDGALWMTAFSDYSGGCSAIESMTATGAFTAYQIPSTSSGSCSTAQLNLITSGPDGALWFTQEAPDAIGRITTSGAVTEYPLPVSGSFPWAITTGPDGALWFVERSAGKIGRITTGGTLTEYPVVQPTSSGGIPCTCLFGIASAGNAVWFTEPDANKIGSITTSGKVKTYTVPTKKSSPSDIVKGPDDALWFTEGTAIGRITREGSFSEFPIPPPYYFPVAMAVGPDRAIWFTEWTKGPSGGSYGLGRIATIGTR
jgi:streptogramin lyase